MPLHVLKVSIIALILSLMQGGCKTSKAGNQDSNNQTSLPGRPDNSGLEPDWFLAGAHFEQITLIEKGVEDSLSVAPLKVQRCDFLNRPQGGLLRWEFKSDETDYPDRRLEVTVESSTMPKPEDRFVIDAEKADALVTYVEATGPAINRFWTTKYPSGTCQLTVSHAATEDAGMPPVAREAQGKPFFLQGFLDCSQLRAAGNDDTRLTFAVKLGCSCYASR